MCCRTKAEEWVGLSAGLLPLLAKMELAANQRSVERIWREERFVLLYDVRWDRPGLTV